MKQIAILVNEQELIDFYTIKKKLERRSDADTIRAMISFCKKNLDKTVDISTKQTPATPNN